MRSIFADTSYWIAILHPKDKLHERAFALSFELTGVQIVTSEMCLVEVLNYFSGVQAYLRRGVVTAIEKILDNGKCRVIPQTSSQFTNALRLYKMRHDKHWSLTDCASILIMQEQEIQEVLTYDNHFAQAGFTALLRPTL